MKVDLTQDQQDQLESALAKNMVRKWFTYKDKMKFEIGDVLIKSTSRRDYDLDEDIWVVENINSEAKMSQRYVYIFEDNNGIGYLKHLRVSDGALGRELFCLTDFDYDTCRFEVDPEFAETTFLGAEFDIKAVHKASTEQRKLVIKMNRKIGVKPRSIKELNKFFENVGVGGTFYTTRDFTGKREKSYVIVNMRKVKIATLEAKADYWFRRVKERKDLMFDDSYTYILNIVGGYSQGNPIIEFYHQQCLYTQKPIKEDNQ